MLHSRYITAPLSRLLGYWCDLCQAWTDGGNDPDCPPPAREDVRLLADPPRCVRCGCREQHRLTSSPGILRGAPGPRRPLPYRPFSERTWQ